MATYILHIEVSHNDRPAITAKIKLTTTQTTLELALTAGQSYVNDLLRDITATTAREFDPEGDKTVVYDSEPDLDTINPDAEIL